MPSSALRAADEEGGQAHGLRAPHVRLRIIAHHPRGVCAGDRLEHAVEGSWVGLLVSALGRVEDLGYVSVEAEVVVILVNSGTWFERIRCVQPREESLRKAGTASSRGRQWGGSTYALRTLPASSSEADGSNPLASKAPTKTGIRASHHRSGEDSSGWGTSGVCQGKPLRSCAPRRSLSKSWPGIASCSTVCSAEAQRPARYPSVPSKSQIKNRTMGLSCPSPRAPTVPGHGRAVRW